MGLEVSELENAVDVLTAGFTSSLTELIELSEAMKFIGPVAKSSGRSLEEIVAILRALADVNIRASMAGTVTRNMLIRLAGGNREARKELDKMNISLDDNEGKLRPISDIIDQVNRATSSMTAVERTGTIARIAGLRAISGFTELLDLGGDALRRYEADLRSATGTAANIASIQLDTSPL